MEVYLEKLKKLKQENDTLFQIVEEKNQLELNVILEVNLNFKKISQKIVHPYFDIISKIKNNTLKKIELSNQNLSDLDIKSIIDALMENESVKVVNFSFNPKIKGKDLGLEKLISYNDTISE